jgi:Ca2+-binding EF-hand superfamily protein
MRMEHEKAQSFTAIAAARALFHNAERNADSGANNMNDQTTPQAYKPSPLSFGSPRTSPFRRAESPVSTRQTESPSPSPTKQPSQWLPRGLPPSNSAVSPPSSPTHSRGGATVRASSPASAFQYDGAPAKPINPSGGNQYGGTLGNNKLSQLDPAQVRDFRESFQVLDRDSDGIVKREDVVAMLTDLGQDSSQSAVSAFFPPGAPQILALPQYLTTLSSLLSEISPSQELISAFAAFDEDDSGQVDLQELRDAVLHTAPDRGGRAMSEREVDNIMSGFAGRRAFGGKGKRGDVFRYQEFVNAVGGTTGHVKGQREVDA